MATKKKAASTAVVPAVAGRALVVPGSWREKAKTALTKQRETLAKLPQQGGNFLSFQGGVISYNGATLPNPLPIVIVAHGYERGYYSKPYQPDVAAVPDCYSYGDNAPHEKASAPQSDACSTCRWNAFETAMQGKGKGCKEGAKLVVMAAQDLDSPQKVLTAPLVQARLSVLNSKTFAAFAGFFNTEDSPLFGRVILLRNRPDPKSQYAVSFEVGDIEFGDDMLDAVAARMDEAEKLLVQPYPEPDAIAKPQKPARPTGKAVGKAPVRRKI